MVGGRNFKLKTAGRCLRYYNYGTNGHKTIGNWYTTILQAAGFPHQNHFEQTDPNLRDIDIKGPLAELVG